MQEIRELEQRITAALERIGTGLEAVAAAAVAAAPAAGAIETEASTPDAPATRGVAEAASGTDAGSAELRAALEDERMANAQLTERLRAVKEREGAKTAELQAEITRQARQLDTQGLEMKRLRMVTVQLREHMRMLLDAQQAETTEPHLLNKAMLAELEALRAARDSEVVEIDEILAELAPLLTMEKRQDA